MKYFAPILLVVACALGFTLGNFNAVANAPPPSPKWEYKMVAFLTAVVANKTAEERNASQIDEFGKLGVEGWELVAVSEEKVAYFKRQK